MEWLSNLHVAMSVIVFLVIVSTARLYRYKNALERALFWTQQPEVKNVASNIQQFNHNKEQAQQHLIAYSTGWIPFVFFTLAMVSLIWTLAYFKQDLTGVAVITAGLIAAIVTRAITLDPLPEWLTDWHVAMIVEYNSAQLKVKSQQFEQLKARAEQLNRNDLTDQELTEFVKVIIEITEIGKTVEMIQHSQHQCTVYYEEKAKRLNKGK